MAYDKEEVFEEVIKVIRDNKLKHFYYIEGFIEPTTPTLYEFFPLESDEFNTIKRELGLNKIASKNKMVNKWEDSENAALQIAAFKLIATDEEREALSTNYQKVDQKTEDITLTPEEREAKIKDIESKLKNLER